jgi:hypothetical protein
MSETAGHALSILNVSADLKDERLKHAALQVMAFVDTVERAHAPLTGEAYPEDRNRYCAVCMSGDGGSRRWPCGTLKAVWQFLRERDKGRYTTNTKRAKPR